MALKAGDLRRLQENDPTFTEVELSGFDLTDADAIAIATALKTNTSVKKLSLRSNKIGAKGAIALAEALMVNKTLIHLELNGNRIGPEGATAFAKVLEKNTPLKCLELVDTYIMSPGCQALAKGLERNSTLIKLKIYSRHEHADYYDQCKKVIGIFKPVLAVNSTLLDFDGNYAEYSSSEINDSLQRNKGLATYLDRLDRELLDVNAKKQVIFQSLETVRQIMLSMQKENPQIIFPSRAKEIFEFAEWRLAMMDDVEIDFTRISEFSTIPPRYKNIAQCYLKNLVHCLFTMRASSLEEGKPNPDLFVECKAEQYRTCLYWARFALQDPDMRPILVSCVAGLRGIKPNSSGSYSDLNSVLGAARLISYHQLTFNVSNVLLRKLMKDEAAHQEEIKYLTKLTESKTYQPEYAKALLQWCASTGRTAQSCVLLEDFLLHPKDFYVQQLPETKLEDTEKAAKEKNSTFRIDLLNRDAEKLQAQIETDWKKISDVLQTIAVEEEVEQITQPDKSVDNSYKLPSLRKILIGIFLFVLAISALTALTWATAGLFAPAAAAGVLASLHLVGAGTTFGLGAFIMTAIGSMGFLALIGHQIYETFIAKPAEKIIINKDNIAVTRMQRLHQNGALHSKEEVLAPPPGVHSKVFAAPLAKEEELQGEDKDLQASSDQQAAILL